MTRKIPNLLEIAILAAGNDQTSGLATEYLESGSPEVLEILADNLDETERNVSMITNRLKLKDVWLFKTYGLFYLGRVARFSPSWIGLQRGSSKLVVEVGETSAAFTEGNIAYQESHPSRILLNPIHIHACEEWTMPLTTPEIAWKQEDPSYCVLQPGETWLFKTYGLFYLGRIAWCDTNTIELEKGYTKLVVEVGETSAAFVEGNIAYQESHPSRVILNTIHIHACEEWTKPLKRIGE